MNIDKDEIEELVVFKDTVQFHKEVEELVLDDNCGYIDAVLKIALKYDIDPEDISTIIDNTLKQKIQSEAQKLSLLKYRKKKELDL